MKINISGKNIELGQALQTHIEARLQESIYKYIDRINVVDVVISKRGHQFHADIHANIGTHASIMVNSHAENADVYAAFDLSAERIEKQLRRYKRRITSHHKEREGDISSFARIQAMDYTLAPEQDNEELEAAVTPVVIAERPTDVETLSVSEAVMKMDLANMPALLFYNTQHGRINLVYRREDGHISWVDPTGQAAA